MNKLYSLCREANSESKRRWGSREGATGMENEAGTMSKREPAFLVSGSLMNYL